MKRYAERIIKARRKYAMLLDPLETRATLGYARLAGDCYRPQCEREYASD